MPRIKKAPSDKKYSNERFKIMDSLLAGGKNIFNRESFISQINKLLSQEDKISDATFDKDLSAFKKIVKEDSGGSVSVVNKRDVGYHYSDSEFTLFPELINPEERYLLEAATNLLQVFKGTSLETKCNDVFKRIIANGDYKGSYFEREREHVIQLTSNSMEGGERWIEPLLQAILKKEALEIKYQNTQGQISKKIISPYALKNYHGKWFFVAHDQLCKREDKTNVFAVNSVLSLDYSNRDYFQDDFDINHYFKYSLGIWHQHKIEPVDVVLEFKESRAREIQEYPLHTTQHANYDNDRKVLTVQLTVYNTPELEMLIQQYGNAVKVISPQTLVDKIKHNLQSALEQY